MKKDELFQEVKNRKISINDARERLGLERVDHPLMNSKMTNEELFLQNKSTPAATEADIKGGAVSE